MRWYRGATVATIVPAAATKAPAKMQTHMGWISADIIGVPMQR